MVDEPEGVAGRGRAERAFGWAVVAVAVSTVIAIVVLWPGDAGVSLSEGLTAPTEGATVEEVRSFECPPPQPGTCGEVVARLETGPDAGSETTIGLGGTAGPQPQIEPGDELRVTAVAPPTVPPPGREELRPGAGAQGPPGYTLTDFERRGPLLWLALAFAVLVIAFGRLRGALSLAGLAGSLAVILVFIVPAILDGRSPLAVALVGSVAAMLVTIPLAHGLGPKSVAAMLGTTVSLALVVGLATLWTELSHLTGFASEEATILNLAGADLSLDGLLVAGMVIGALGVLDDVTVSQASTVLALRSANPGLAGRELYLRALRVGRDHVSATVNTLVLAYAGSSLPVLLLLSSGDLGLVDAFNSELVAKEIVATLVGSIGLIAAVPVTTALATVLARDVPAGLAAEAGHAH